MIIDNDGEHGAFPVPFLLRFAQRLPDIPDRPLRYDAARQLGQILVEGRWVDSLDVSFGPEVETLCTKVDKETTDDQ